MCGCMYACMYIHMDINTGIRPDQVAIVEKKKRGQGARDQLVQECPAEFVAGNMTHPCLCVTCLIPMCGMTPSYV